jgi:threonine/homoserine/homoserine lactone efflux protein
VSAATGIKRLGLAVVGIVVAGFAFLLALSFLISADTVRESVKSQIRAVTGFDRCCAATCKSRCFPAAV